MNTIILLAVFGSVSALSMGLTIYYRTDNAKLRTRVAAELAAYERLQEQLLELSGKYEAQITLREVDSTYVREARQHFAGLVNVINHLGYDIELDGNDVLLRSISGDTTERISTEVH